MKNSKLLLGLSSLLVLMLHTGATWAATAGYVQFVNGAVSLTTTKGVTHALQKGEAVSEGDTVNTAQNASAQIKMQDGGFIAVRPDTQLKFDSFKFTGKAGQPESSFFSLFRGGFRAVTGLIGRVKKQDYRISTPAATIGIRGTDHETIYLPANIPGAMAGAYSKVNIGEISLTTNRGTINVLPNQMGFAGGLNQVPQLQPINTTIFTVAVAPREVKVSKESKSGSKEQGAGQAPQAAPKEEKETAGTGQEQQPAVEAPGEQAPAASEPIRDTAVVDNTKLAPNINTTVTSTAAAAAPASAIETAAVTPPAPATTVLPVTASSGALTLNATAQTVASGGTTVSVQNGIYSTQAKTAADAALVAAQTAAAAATAAASEKTTLLAIAMVSTAPATTAIGNASTAISTASSGATLAVNNALAQVTVNATTATGNATAAQAAATTTASQAVAAQTAITTHGTFADSTAAPANTATQAANTAVQAANATVQTNAATVTAQNTVLTNAQTAANTALNSASSSLVTANSTLGTVSTQNTAITTAQSSAAALLSTAQAAAAAANTAALAAQAAATQAASLQSAGDLTGAAAQLAIAQQQLAIAQTERANAQAAQAAVAAQLANAQAAQATANNVVTSAVSVANVAVTAANTAQTQATNASSAAVTAATSALAQTVAATTGTAANTVQTQAGIVAANAPIAAYNNPAVASSNFIGHLAMPAPATPSGYNIAQEQNNAPQAHTKFVLDGNGNLVEMRGTSFQIQPMQSTPTTSLTNADVKWSGGSAADTFKLADNSIYAGRWVGATVTVTDLATTGTVAPFSLTPANSLWTVLLTPTSGYVQSLVGATSYTKAGNTTPFDAAGNLGTLTNATLSADFTSQLVSATLALTMPAASSMAGSYAVTANNMPISVASGNGAGFSFGGTTTPTVSCTGTCVAGAGGYSANVGGSFAGTAAASAGLGYDIWPTTVGTNLPVNNLVQGLVAFATATAPAPGTNPAVGTYLGGLSSSVAVPGGFFIAESPAAAVNYALYPTIGSPNPNTDFILDASGNLIRILASSYSEYPVMPNAYVTPTANAQVTFAGGTAADYFKAADNSLTFGRWQGGSITIKDNVAGTSVVKPLLAANGTTPTNTSWYLFVPSAANYTQGLTGTTTYTKVAAVQPTDTLGTVGLLNSATLSANFSLLTVDATANLTIATKTFNVQTLGLPIVASSFSADPQYSPGVGGATGPMATTTCTGAACAASYQSRFGGIFLGNTASNVLVHYDIWPTTTPGTAATDIVQGLIAFNTATAPTIAAPAAYNTNLVAVETAGGMNWNSGMLAAPADLVYVTGTAGGASSSGALSSMTFRDIGGGSAYTQTSTITGGTAISANAPAFATTGIQYGAWTGYTGQSNTWSSLLGGKGGSTPTSWMYGPQGYLDTAYLSGPSVIGAMAGTFTYQMDGATAPHSQNSGLTGTLTSASITANFVSMLVSANLALTMPGNENWGASATNLPFSSTSGGQFSGFASPGGVGNTLTVTHGVNVAAGACATCGGTLGGAFTGQNYAGAILSYSLYNNAQTTGGDVAGHVALTRNFAGNTNPNVANGTAAPTGNLVVADWAGTVGQYPVASSTTTGNLLTAFGGTGYSTSVTCTTCTTTASGQVASSGIHYGNWTAGSYSQSYSATFTAGTMPPSYWITGPEAGPLYLPEALTGTASYAFNAGQVSNSAGVAGTVSTTTALTLDFNKQTVGINLDVSIASTAATPAVHVWNAKTVTGQEAVLGTGMGISGAGFYASTSNTNNGGGSGLLTLTVDAGATAVTNTSAYINGQLTGSGLTGAIMSFNLGGMLNTATPSFEYINGVAAFTGTAANTATPHRYIATAFYDPFTPVPQPVLGFYANNSTRVTQDVAGNLTQFDTQFISNNSGGSSMTLAKNTSTVADYGTDAVSGISWGRWAGGTFNATDRKTAVVTPVTSAGSLHWIAESVATAATTLPTVGTYTYIKAGNTLPTDNLGNVGTLNSATLSANFTAQTVNLGVNATVAGATLNAAGTNVPIIQKTAFYASSQEPAASTSHLAVTCTGTCGATLGGTVIGKFSGAGAIGAAMTYGLQNGSSTISGVAAFHR